jgi:hypothetical protein
MSSWFSNRGQIVQVVVAITAAVIGLLAAVRQDYIKVEFAIALVFLAILALWLLFRRFEGQIAKVMGSVEPTHSQTLSLLPEKFTAKWSQETIKLRKGERWTDQDKKNEIRLLDVRSSPEGRAAVISTRAELNYFCAGVNVERLGSDFVLPETSFHDQASIIVSYTVANTFLLCFSVRAEHVNPHANEVEFVITKIAGSHL